MSPECACMSKRSNAHVHGMRACARDPGGGSAAGRTWSKAKLGFSEGVKVVHEVPSALGLRPPPAAWPTGRVRVRVGAARGGGAADARARGSGESGASGRMCVQQRAPGRGWGWRGMRRGGGGGGSKGEGQQGNSDAGVQAGAVGWGWGWNGQPGGLRARPLHWGGGPRPLDEGAWRPVHAACVQDAGGG